MMIPTQSYAETEREPGHSAEVHRVLLAEAGLIAGGRRGKLFIRIFHAIRIGTNRPTLQA